ncbi:uncharacterized protein LOC119079069 [Bradysia coprophila]|nr:uncharacterized protein LOC119079069 [Bradysia coprophila]
MVLKIFVPLLTVFLTTQLVASAYIPFLYPENIGAKTTIVSSDNEGNLVLKSFSGIDSKLPHYDSPQEYIEKHNGSTIYKVFQDDTPAARTDYLEIPGNFTLRADKLAGRATATGPAVIEVVIVVDKAFGDVFQQNYQRVVDYLTIYFWDVNIRYKTLWSVDLSFRVNGLLIMASTGAQPFIENAKASDGRTEHGRTLNLFKNWIYQQRSWLVRHDMAVLITNANTEWGGGLAWGGGACSVDTNSGTDWGTVVWNDNGGFGSVTVGAHEMAHNVGAPHDDDPNANCPGPYGFIMSGGNDDRRYFFQRCSDAAISSFVNSDKGACLRRFDGYETTPMDRSFSSPKAGTMQDMCRTALNNPNAWIDTADTFNCKNMVCRRRDDSNPNVVWMHSVSPIDNIQCGNGGRCFRGKCRPDSKLLRNEGSGFCLNSNSRFGFTVQAQMFACPSAKDRTPLDTLEIVNVPNGKLLASPFLNDENKE